MAPARRLDPHAQIDRMNENNVELHLPSRVDTPNFVLRVMSASDVPALQVSLEKSDAHLRPWTPWVIDGRVPGLTLEQRLAIDAEAFESSERWVYGIFSVDGTEVIGGCGIYPRVGPRAVEIGYWVAASHTRRGIARQATAELTKLAFASPGVDHIDIRCEARNAVSARVASGLGYRMIDPAASSAPPIPGSESVPLQTWRMTREEFNRAFGRQSRFKVII
jgi:Acetyltransferases, including N-acetylases of ribosomal proteins